MTRKLFMAGIAFFSLTASIAHADPSLSQLKRQTANYYRNYARLSVDDQNDAAAAIAEELADASPALYNAVLVHLMAHYREDPTHRASIEVLTRAIHAQVAEELNEDRNRDGVLTYAKDVITVFATYYTARSLWAARSRQTFRLAELWDVAGELAAAGSILGGSHAIYDEMREHRQDPIAALSRVREQLVDEMAREVRDLRAEYQRTLAESDAQLATHLNATRIRLARMRTRSESVERELNELVSFAPELRGPVRAVLAGWVELSRLDDSILVKVDQVQFGDEDDLSAPFQLP